MYKLVAVKWFVLYCFSSCCLYKNTIAHPCWVNIPVVQCVTQSASHEYPLTVSCARGHGMSGYTVFAFAAHVCKIKVSMCITHCLFLGIVLFFITRLFTNLWTVCIYLELLNNVYSQSNFPNMSARRTWAFLLISRKSQLCSLSVIKNSPWLI